MADIQVINVGPAPNDGLGDPIRTAFEKTNYNFFSINDELGNVTNNAVLGAVNVGSSGLGVLKGREGTVLEFKKLVAGTGITLSEVGNDQISIVSTASFNLEGLAGSFVTIDGAGGLTVAGVMRYDQSTEKILIGTDLDMDLNKINNVSNPVAGQDAATKSYVDGLISSIGGGVSLFDDGIPLGLVQQMNFIGSGVTLTQTAPSRVDIAVTAGTDTPTVQNIVGAMFTDNTNQGILTSYSPEVQKVNIAVKDFNIKLQGPVTGSALVQDFTNDIIIQTEANFLQGLTVSKNAINIGSQKSVDSFNFVGDNIAVTRVGSTITVAVNPGLTDTDVRNEIGTTVKGVVSDPLDPVLVTESGITTRYVAQNNTLELGVRDFNINISGAVQGSGTVSRLQDVNIVTTSNAIEGLTLLKDGLQIGTPQSIRTINFLGDNITAVKNDSTATISVSSTITGDQVSSVLNPRMLGRQDGLDITFDSLNKVYNYRLNPITINLAGAVSGSGIITFDGTAVDGNVTINTSGAGGGGGITVKDEGNTQGQASTLNFVGGGITTAVSIDGTVATVYVPNSPAAEPFITATPGSENIPNARLLQAGTGVIITDTGPGGSITISANNDAILAKSQYALNGAVVAEEFGINLISSRFITPIMENDTGNSRVNLTIYDIRDAWYRLGSYNNGSIIDNQGPALDNGPIIGGILETTPDLGFIV